MSQLRYLRRFFYDHESVPLDFIIRAIQSQKRYILHNWIKIQEICQIQEAILYFLIINHPKTFLRRASVLTSKATPAAFSGKGSTYEEIVEEAGNRKSFSGGQKFVKF